MSRIRKPLVACAILTICSSLASALAADDSRSKDLKLERLDFESFAVSLPDWKRTENTARPVSGSLRLENSGLSGGGARGILAVKWQPISQLESEQDDARKMLVSGVAKAAGITTRPIELGNRRWLEIESKGVVAIGGAYCPSGVGIYITMGIVPLDPELLRAQLQRIVESIECGSTAVSLHAPVLSFALPAGFGVADASSTPVYYSIEGDVIATSFTSGNMLKDTKLFDTIMSAMLSSIPGVELTSVKSKSAIIERADKALSALTVVDANVEKEPAQFYLGTLYCESDTGSHVMFMGGDAFSEVKARQLTASMNCAAPTKAPPTVLDVFGNVCLKSNEVAACSAILALIDDGSVKADAAAKAEFATKACKLGAKEHCR